jgi:hypothetical protein
MTTTKVTLTLDEADAAGNPLSSGSVRIVPSTRFADTADSLIVGQVPVRADFTSAGAPTVELYPNDLVGPQSGGSPQWAYTIYYDSVPGNPPSWSFQVLSTNGDTQSLHALSPVSQPAAYSPYVLASSYEAAALASSFTSGTGTSAQNVTGLSVPLGVGTWKVRAWLPYAGGGTVGSTQTFAFSFSGTAGSGTYAAWKNNAAAYAAPAAGSAVTTGFTTPTITSTVYVLEFSATVVVTEAGTLQLTVQSATSGDEVTVEGGALLEATLV